MSQDKNPWIRVTEQLPEKGTEVFVMVQTSDGEGQMMQHYGIARYHGERWRVGDVDLQYDAHTWGEYDDGTSLIFWVTHWMPFPPLPGTKQKSEQ